MSDEGLARAGRAARSVWVALGIEWLGARDAGGQFETVMAVVLPVLAPCLVQALNTLSLQSEKWLRNQSRSKSAVTLCTRQLGKQCLSCWHSKVPLICCAKGACKVHG